MQEKNGMVAVGSTKDEDSLPCTGVDKDGEPVAGNPPLKKASVRDLAEVMPTGGDKS